MPENTIPAMIKALELGVTTLEMDVVVTADSQVILSHEPFFNHEISTKPDGTPVAEAEERTLNIYRMKLEQVQLFDVGMAPHPRFAEQQKMPAVKPLLKDVISEVKAWCKEHGRPVPYFNIETKCLPEGDDLFHPGPERFVDLLVQVLQEAATEDRTIIQSFDFRTLRYARRTYPGIRLAALVEEDDKADIHAHLDVLGFVPEIYSPAWQRVTPELVSACKERGMKLIPWTVNDVEIAERLRSMGVDGLITDYPDRVR